MTAENPRVPKPPAGLKASGRALWREVQAEYELEQHEVGLLLTMCRTTDRLDDLAGILAREGVIEAGTGRVHPCLVEHRQQAIAYVRVDSPAPVLRGPSRALGLTRRGARRGFFLRPPSRRTVAPPGFR
jgi:hypothetical protein